MSPHLGKRHAVFFLLALLLLAFGMKARDINQPKAEVSTQGLSTICAILTKGTDFICMADQRTNTVMLETSAEEETAARECIAATTAFEQNMKFEAPWTINMVTRRPEVRILASCTLQ